MLYGVDVKHGKTLHCPNCGHFGRATYASRCGRDQVDEEYHAFYRRCENGDVAVLGMWCGHEWSVYAGSECGPDSFGRTPLEMYVTEICVIPQKGRKRRWAHNL